MGGRDSDPEDKSSSRPFLATEEKAGSGRKQTMKMMKTALLLLAFLCVAWAQDVLEYDDYDSVRRLYYCSFLR